MPSVLELERAVGADELPIEKYEDMALVYPTAPRP
jgi:hypothetical protein